MSVFIGFIAWWAIGVVITVYHWIEDDDIRLLDIFVIAGFAWFAPLAAVLDMIIHIGDTVKFPPIHEVVLFKKRKKNEKF